MSLHRILHAGAGVLACALGASCGASPDAGVGGEAGDSSTGDGPMPQMGDSGTGDGPQSQEASVLPLGSADNDSTGSGSPCLLRNGAWIDLTCGSGQQYWGAVASDASGEHLVAGSGIVIPPPDGVFNGAWTSINAGQTWSNVDEGSMPQAVATNSTGTVLVAADASNTNPAYLHVSTNAGATWTRGPSSDGWGGVASDSTGANLVAVGALSGDIWTSTDSGATWTDRTTSGPAHSRYWASVASDSTGTRLVAVEGGEVFIASGQVAGDIWTSTDSGTTWTDQTPSGSAHNLSWLSVASDAAGKNLVAVGPGIWTSSDSGATWTRQVTSVAAYAWLSVASSADGTQLVAATIAATGDDGDLWTSSDSGVTWTNQTTGTFLATQHWMSVASDTTGTRLLAAADDGDIWLLSADTIDAGAPDAGGTVAPMDAAVTDGAADD
jgi:hypothetical protein